MQSRRVNRAPRRKLVWARTLLSINLASSTPADTAWVNLLGQFETQYGADMLGCTIMRIRGNVTWNLTSVNVVPQAGAHLIVGAMIATSETAGPPNPPAELPDSAGPATNPHADWMLWQSITAVTNGDGSNLIDSKSMRRLDELSQYLVLGVQLGTPAVAIAGIAGTFSTLIALP